MNEEATAERSSILLEAGIASIDPPPLFGREAPLEVDLGAGTGTFLVALAKQFPERNFLGVERLLNRVGKVCRSAARLDLTNVRIFRGQIDECLRLLPTESVAVFHVLFPDPWPKRRHHSRRLINDAFLRAAWSVLNREGEIRFMTDDETYFGHARKVAQAHPFIELPWPEDPSYPATDFEARFLAEGRTFHRLRLLKKG